MFYTTIEQLCLLKGISVSKLAEETGLATASVIGWKNGSKPRNSTVRKLADYFGVEPSSLIDGSAVDRYKQAHNTEEEIRKIEDAVRAGVKDKIDGLSDRDFERLMDILKVTMPDTFK